MLNVRAKKKTMQENAPRLYAALTEAREAIVYYTAISSGSGMDADTFSKFLEAHPGSKSRTIEKIDKALSAARGE